MLLPRCRHWNTRHLFNIKKWQFKNTRYISCPCSFFALWAWKPCCVPRSAYCRNSRYRLHGRLRRSCKSCWSVHSSKCLKFLWFSANYPLPCPGKSCFLPLSAHFYSSSPAIRCLLGLYCAPLRYSSSHPLDFIQQKFCMVHQSKNRNLHSLACIIMIFKHNRTMVFIKIFR